MQNASNTGEETEEVNTGKGGQMEKGIQEEKVKLRRPKRKQNGAERKEWRGLKKEVHLR